MPPNKKWAVFLTAPTKLAYHRKTLLVNENMGGNGNFCVLNDWRSGILWNIPP
jgi:hypothetical protein